MTDYIKKGDITIYNLFNRRLHCTILDIFMRYVTHLGSLGISIVLPLALLASRNEFAKEIGIHMSIVILVSQLAVQIIKRLVNRKRPYNMVESILIIKPPSCQYSFPSGHTASAFAIAFPAAYSLPFIAPLFFVLAFAVGISRIYLGFHYPTDTLVGFLIAYISMFISLALII